MFYLKSAYIGKFATQASAYGSRDYISFIIPKKYINASHISGRNRKRLYFDRYSTVIPLAYTQLIKRIRRQVDSWNKY